MKQQVHKSGDVIDYKFMRTGGVFTGTILYIDDEKIKLTGPPPSGLSGAEQFQQYKRRRKQKNIGSWYWLDELEILSD